jgi:protein TonB
MNTLGHDYRFQTRDPSRRVTGLAIVILLHLFLGYALVSGMARKGLNLIKKPLEAVVIQEVIIPPPPPPPPPKPQKPPEPDAPKVDAPPPFVPPPEVEVPVVAAPSIVAVATPPAEPPPMPAPPPVKAPVNIRVVCPVQTPPEMPRKAIQDGTQGVVKAQVLIKDGVVQEVTILSGPRVFHSTVRSAIMQYKCSREIGEIIATQEFSFKLE